MSYTVLARKWRPQQFDEVVGQAHVTRGLMNALSMGRVAHAFLFSGTRGVGKTTTARILAKALNCESGPTPSPCGSCGSCTEITEGSSVDVMEIDAASNTSVENVREINENVRYAPARGRYKVYIIDEVHMLSNSAFNALLKTLEEPPPHIVFIFATTDPHKLPATILSRCQHYDFRRVPKAKIQEHLAALCAREGITAEPAALSRLAGLAEGSVRDGLSLLDQVVSYCGDAGVREEDLDDILGLVGRQAVKEAASAVLAQDPAGAFSLVDSLVDKGQDLRRFSAELLGFFRDLLVCRISKAPERALDLPAAEAAEYKEMAANLAPEEIIRVMNLLTRLTEEMKWSANPRISLELALVKAASRPIASVEEIIAGIKGAKDILPRGRAGQAPGRVQETPPPPARQATDSAPARKEEHKGDEAYYSYSAAGKTDDGDPAADLWDRVREEIKKQSKAPLAAKMKAAAPKKVEGGVLTVVEGLIPFKPEEVELIAQAADGLGGVKVKILQQSGGKEKTLADHKKERETTKREKIKEEAVKDPIVRSALDLFGGEIVDVESEKTGS